jgi:hypothetical protein
VNWDAWPLHVLITLPESRRSQILKAFDSKQYTFKQVGPSVYIKPAIYPVVRWFWITSIEWFGLNHQRGLAPRIFLVSSEVSIPSAVAGVEINIILSSCHLRHEYGIPVATLHLRPNSLISQNDLLPDTEYFKFPTCLLEMIEVVILVCLMTILA